MEQREDGEEEEAEKEECEFGVSVGCRSRVRLF